MKKILYLSFYFRPDLCAGSFRNSPLLDELGKQAKEKNVSIDVYTTPPQRYSSFSESFDEIEDIDNVHIERVIIPKHQSGIKDQINSFKVYFTEVNKRIKGKKYDLVFASSSRLFTAYLGYRIAKKQGVPLYLDIRDIFTDTIEDVIKNPLVKLGMVPFLKYIEKKVFGSANHINLISGGFKPYFTSYKQASYTYFTNGIDDAFISASEKESEREVNKIKRTVYAGNIGQGQGLHKIVPQAAKLLGNSYEFLIIGDGGVRKLLEEEITRQGVSNVILKNPVNRKELIEEYIQADYLFIHLNDYDAFKKVLPSKIFELGVFKKPLIAGVAGYANDFLKTNLSGTILFAPGDYQTMVKLMQEKGDVAFDLKGRDVFIDKYNRKKINAGLAESILSYLD
ncbi:MAG: hypothetical protein ACJA0Q_001037 [Saprospiraceae bacterium]|jgi:hypothetical protein